MCVCQSLSHVALFVNPWTVAHQVPLSMAFARQEYWSGLPFPSPGDLPDPGIERGSPELQADSLPSEPPIQISIQICQLVYIYTHTHTHTHICVYIYIDHIFTYTTYTNMLKPHALLLSTLQLSINKHITLATTKIKKVSQTMIQITYHLTLRVDCQR